MKLLIYPLLCIAVLSLTSSASPPGHKELNLDQSTSTLALNVALLKLLDQNESRRARYLIEHSVNHNIYYLTKFRRRELTEVELRVLAQAVEYRRTHPFRRSDYGHESIPEDQEVNNVAK